MQGERWEWSAATDGVGEVTVSSWRGFLNFIHDPVLANEGYIWRGQRCDYWPLESTLLRLTRKNKISTENVNPFAREHLNRFIYAVRGRRGRNPSVIGDDNEWWALGQHYGLATPLLDWTNSPFVAAYFAFIGQGEQQSNSRTVYALHRPSIENIVSELQKITVKQSDQKKRQLESEGRKGGFEYMLWDGLGRAELEGKFITPMSDENQRYYSRVAFSHIFQPMPMFKNGFSSVSKGPINPY